MTAIDTAALRALAERAKEGPWFGASILTTGGGPLVSDDAQFIAACSPSVLLALLDEVEAARKDAARYRFLRDNGLGKALRARDAMMELAFGYPDDETVFKSGITGGYTCDLIDTALDIARGVRA